MAGERRPMNHGNGNRRDSRSERSSYFERNSRSGGRDFNHRGQESHSVRRETSEEEVWYDAVCSQCGDAFRVPFEPNPEREILCKSCLRASREERGGSGHRNERRFDGEHRAHRERREPETYSIVCSHCGKEDTVPFRPYEGSIVLCHECMSNPNVERQGGKIYHTIICSVCGKENKVPFKPDPGSRVLCRECHAAEREEKQRSREYFAKHHPSVVHNTKVRIEITCERCGCTDTLPFVPKTHGMILCRQCAENTFGDEWARRNRLGAHEYPFTCARCAKQDFVPFKPKEGQELLCRHCLDDQVVLKHSRSEMKRRDFGTCVRKNDEE